MFGATHVCESTFLTVNFMKSNFRSLISDENIAFKLRCVISEKYILDYKALPQKEGYELLQE